MINTILFKLLTVLRIARLQADALRFTISSTGNVGIGAENPESLLHLYTSNVNGAGSRLIFGDDLLNGRTNAYIAEWGWQTNTDSDILELSGYTGIKFTTGSRSANTPMEINSSGNIVVIGKISGVTDPVDAQDAATKANVDLLESKIEELEAMIGSEQGVVIDIDNNRYHIVTIGTQTWMAENLKVTRYNDGTSIPLVTDNVAWSNLSTPGYTWYNNSSSDYGALYNWYTVSNGIKNVCPTGWHIPTDDEWGNLVSFLGGSDNAMGKMKQSGLANWTMPNTAATNDSGFVGLPGGNRWVDGSFQLIGNLGNWWSSTAPNATDAWSRYLSHDNSYPLYSAQSGKKIGNSIRCLKD